MNDHNMQLLTLMPLFQQVLAKAGIHRTKTGSTLEITTLQATALGIIYKNNKLTMSELAKEMGVIQSAATRIGDELVRRDMVRRVNDDNDRRVTRLRITPKGRESIENLRQESQLLLSLVLKEMTPLRQEELARGLRTFLEAVQTVEQNTNPGCVGDKCADKVSMTKRIA